MPTIQKKTISSNSQLGKIAQASVKGVLKINQFILDYSELPKIKVFKESYEEDAVYTLLEDLFRAALCSNALLEWTTEKRTEILHFYYDMQAACFELLASVPDPE